MDINTRAQALWPNLPIISSAQNAKGWTVQFITLVGNVTPALSDLGSKRIVNAKLNDLERLDGISRLIAVDGIEQLNRNLFCRFKGDDAIDGMCEIIVKAELGIRVLCFKAEGRILLLASAFRKPAQMQTPPEEKAKAREVLGNFYAGS